MMWLDVATIMQSKITDKETLITERDKVYTESMLLACNPIIMGIEAQLSDRKQKGLPLFAANYSTEKDKILFLTMAYRLKGFYARREILNIGDTDYHILYVAESIDVFEVEACELDEMVVSSINANLENDKPDDGMGTRKLATKDGK